MNRQRGDMKELNLTVTVEEANMILEAIGQLPFARVYQLVAKLQQQAGQQLNSPPTQDNTGGAG